ncbi:monocarboxylate transporter 13-like isoform X1 [Stylophora pistillata]|uniref:monocarboxylate transporter 13-like isoform X1 n=1 Tax=Stylophora pistillata TaxID=50429 RepID=UPI000C050251|nr:monocarboxylate transporter 13-like isoform X1 [Stylophora pistillata]
MPTRNLDVTRSHSSTNIENLTSIPVGGSITLINYNHTQLPDECTTSSAKDRGWAWVVCAGSFFVMFMVYGIHTSFGVLLVVLLDHFKANKASTAWIGSISVNLLFLFSPVTSSLAGRYGVRVVTIAGGIVMSVGLFLSSYAPSLLFLYISYGLLLGIGTSLCATMALIVSADYFDKHLSLATGIVASGSSFGTVIFPPTLQLIVQRYGWESSFRIMGLGGIMMAITGLVYRSVNRQNHVPLGAERNQCFDMSVLNNRGFVLWTVATTIAGFGYFIPHFFLVRHSEDLGIPLSQGSWLISYLGISSALGRLLFGRISDACSFKNIHIYRSCMFLSGLASVLCPLASSYWALVVYVVVLGILDGSYIGLMSIVTLDIVGVHKIAPAWGILFFCQSFTYLLGPPTAGFMYDHLKTFKPVFYLAAGPMIFGAFLLLFAALCKSNQTSLGRQDVISLVSSPKHCDGLDSSCRRCSCPPKIVLTPPGDERSLLVVERLTVI